MFAMVNGLRVWGDGDEGAIAQMTTVYNSGWTLAAALMADSHLGYSQPIGGVIGYFDQVSPTGVGYDIGCGVKAVQTDIRLSEIKGTEVAIAEAIATKVNFGVGGQNVTPHDHSLFDSETWRNVKEILPLKRKAAGQLGTVGSGNHYVDVLVDDDGLLWVACHFGSRGFGHGVASGFINLANGNDWGDQIKGESMHDAPTLIDRSSESYLFDAYLASMNLAGEYAYAGRDYVIEKVLGILGAKPAQEIHNHHNFAWEEEHFGERVFVVRKGATPAFPGQKGFVGGSMGDISAVVEGVESEESALTLYSTVHGAGRVMSRSKAKGSRRKKDGTQRKVGIITRQMMKEATVGVVVRGGDVDESPHVYRRLDGVLKAHGATINVLTTLRPVIVVMAGADVFDPYKD